MRALFLRGRKGRRGLARLCRVVQCCERTPTPARRDVALLSGVQPAGPLLLVVVGQIVSPATPGETAALTEG